MKPPSIAPFYGCLYPGLCEIAQKHGYNLALHGSMARDLDLIAIPWVEEASDPETLVKTLKDHISAVLYPELLKRHCADWQTTPTDEHIHQMVMGQNGYDPKDKPHGRRAWSLHLDFGCYIDLSVMPRVTPSQPCPSA